MCGNTHTINYLQAEGIPYYDSRIVFLWRADQMNGNGTEHWMELCRQAAVEQDPNKLLALTKEINRLLEEKDARLKGNPPPTRAND